MSTNAMGKPVKHFDLITLLTQKYLQKKVFSDVLNLYQYYTQTEPREHRTPDQTSTGWNPQAGTCYFSPFSSFNKVSIVISLVS